MSKRIIGIIALVALLSGLAVIAIYTQDSDDAAYIEKAHAKLSDRLFDPESATYKDEFVVRKEVGPVRVAVCGRVNARNRMGGYVGYKLYVYAFGEDDDGGGMVEPVVTAQNLKEVDNFILLYSNLCGSAGE